MKKILLLFVMALAFSSFAADDAEGIHFFDGSIKEAKNEAKKEGKPLFVFVGQSECDLCRHMKEVFKNQKVAEFYESNFICYKIIDPYKNLLRENMVQNWGVKTVPSYIYFTPKGKKVYLDDGFKDAGTFINQGLSVLDDIKTGARHKKN